jgi:hypothetical protein
MFLIEGSAGRRPEIRGGVAMGSVRIGRDQPRFMR